MKTKDYFQIFSFFSLHSKMDYLIIFCLLISKIKIETKMKIELKIASKIEPKTELKTEPETGSKTELKTKIRSTDFNRSLCSFSYRP